MSPLAGPQDSSHWEPLWDRRGNQAATDFSGVVAGIYTATSALLRGWAPAPTRQIREYFSSSGKFACPTAALEVDESLEEDRRIVRPLAATLSVVKTEAAANEWKAETRKHIRRYMLQNFPVRTSGFSSDKYVTEREQTATSQTSHEHLQKDRDQLFAESSEQCRETSSHSVVPDNATSRRVFFGDLSFLSQFIPALFHTHLTSPSSALKTSITWREHPLVAMKILLIPEAIENVPAEFLLSAKPIAVETGVAMAELRILNTPPSSERSQYSSRTDLDSRWRFGYCLSQTTCASECECLNDVGGERTMYATPVWRATKSLGLMFHKAVERIFARSSELEPLKQVHCEVNVGRAVGSRREKRFSVRELYEASCNDESKLEDFELLFEEVNGRRSELLANFFTLWAKPPAEVAIDMEEVKQQLAMYEAVFRELSKIHNKQMLKRAEVASNSINDNTSSKCVFNQVPVLPTSPMPTFSGNRSEWTRFAELFNSMVGDDPHLTEMSQDDDTPTYTQLMKFLERQAIAEDHIQLIAVKEKVNNKHHKTAGNKISFSAHKFRPGNVPNTSQLPASPLKTTPVSVQEVGETKSAQDMVVAMLCTDHSSPSKVNLVRFPARSLIDSHMWESGQTTPLIGGFSRGSPRQRGSIAGQSSPLDNSEETELTHSIYVYIGAVAVTPCGRIRHRVVFAFEVLKRGADKVDSDVRINCSMAVMCKALNWRAVFSFCLCLPMGL
ncbi:hypothetical protein PR048_032071 [Dryococelus australis]|uniref:Uncharacterized protein n=1 Tax=Dryococelus australis TaxID=614101 RepID=A0ABQ9G162_9NEOP|nr:hypothetical protein PR048_032071 [Dryococelus australis]